jgi:hypothetical protein
LLLSGHPIIKWKLLERRLGWRLVGKLLWLIVLGFQYNLTRLRMHRQFAARPIASFTPRNWPISCFSLKSRWLVISIISFAADNRFLDRLRGGVIRIAFSRTVMH